MKPIDRGTAAAGEDEPGDEDDRRHRRLIGEAVRRERKSQRLTMVQLAERAEVSQGFVSRIETGRVLPSVMTLYRLAEALGCPPATLMPSPEANEEFRLVRAGEALTFSEKPERDMADTPIGRAGPNDQLEAYIYEFDDHTTTWWPYRQETLLYVLQGTVVVDFADGRQILLGTGDSLHFDQVVPTRWIAHEGPVRMLGCHGPPQARHDLSGLTDL